MEQNRKFGTVRAIPENVEETRTIRFLASDDTRDRHGTVINMDNWDLDGFRGNPIIGWQHNIYGDNMCSDPDPDQIIGKGILLMEDKQLFVDIVFEDKENNPLAEKVFRKVVAGILNAVSIGFIEIGNGRTETNEENGIETYYFSGQELLEISVVSIPSNKNALRKSLRGQTASALEYIYRELGGKFRFSEIESMKVRDVMDMIEGKEVIKEGPEIIKEIKIDNNIGEFSKRLIKMKHSALTMGNK